ncbi:hypothetical protein VP018_000627 [Morganella morganii]|nr:hypothetical protein [Morganella morganii]
MSIFGLIRNAFKRKNVKEHKLPTVKCNIRQFVSESDVIRELAPIKGKYSNLIFSDKDMADSILSGFNLKIAADSLLLLNKGKTRREVSPAIYWLSSKCHYLHDSRRAVSSGITHGEWVCCHPYCDGVDGNPSHQKLNGKKFSLKDGLKHKGKIYLPGNEDGCRCTYRPILPF